MKVEAEYVEKYSDVAVAGEGYKAYYCLYMFRFENLKRGVTYKALMYDPSKDKLFYLNLYEHELYRNYNFYSYEESMSSRAKRHLFKTLFTPNGHYKFEEFLEMAEEAGLI